MATKNTDIVPAGDYTIASTDPEMLAEVLQENIGQSLNRFDFDKVGVPAGGATQWVVPTLTGEENVDSLEGIIVYWKEVRAWWEIPFDESGGGTPPDCSSDDGIVARPDGTFAEGSEVNPTGECDKCPMSQWGSARRGDGQSCKQMRVLFMVQPDDMLPMSVTLPPTSIRRMRKYMLRLASKSVPYYAAVTKLGLERVTSNDGIKYSKATPTLGQVIDDPAQVQAVKQYSNAIRMMLDDVVMDTIILSDEPADADDS